jgi:hypothetical protein
MEKLTVSPIVFAFTKNKAEMVSVAVKIHCACHALHLVELMMAGFRCSFAEGRTLSGEIALRDLPAIDKLPFVAFIAPSFEPHALN